MGENGFLNYCFSDRVSIKKIQNIEKNGYFFEKKDEGDEDTCFRRMTGRIIIQKTIQHRFT